MLKTDEVRWVIARDAMGYHVRETLAVKHEGESGEAVYHTKPAGSRSSIRAALKLARRIERRRS